MRFWARSADGRARAGPLFHRARERDPFLSSIPALMSEPLSKSRDWPAKLRNGGKCCPDHLDHRPRRCVPRRIPARQGLCGSRDQTAFVVVQHRARGSLVSGSASRKPSLLLALRRYDGRHQPGAHRTRVQTNGNLQPGSAEPRTGQFRDTRIHGQRGCAGRASPAGIGEDPWPQRNNPILPGVYLGAVRQRRGVSSERANAVPAPKPLWRGKAVRVLDHGELPRSVRDARLQRNPVQPRGAIARRNVRHAQDHARRRGDRTGPRGKAISRESRR